MDSKRRTVLLPSTSLTYHVTRPTVAGTPVVLLHPWFGCWQFWNSIMHHLRGRPCYAVDFYSPASGDWANVASPNGLANAVLAMMDTEQCEQVDLVGNSVGGIVAQLIASTAPQRVRRLVLVGTGASTTGTRPGFAEIVDQWIEAGRAGGTASRSAVEETIAMLFTTRPATTAWETYVHAVLQTDPAYLVAVLNAARWLDLTTRLPRITAQTLVIRGSEDCARTAKHVAVLTEGIPSARAVEMPSAGHSPMVDHPVDFNNVVSTHLEG
jgi:pimeloyl-ACP methyl ester carboxylesterase